MSLPASLPVDDRSLLFADWGEPALLRRTTVVYNPDSGAATESAVDSDLLVIPGPLSTPSTPDAAHQHATSGRTFLIRSADLAAPLSLAASRLVHAGQEYLLDSVEQSALSDIVLFHGRTRS